MLWLITALLFFEICANANVNITNNLVEMEVPSELHEYYNLAYSHMEYVWHKHANMSKVVRVITPDYTDCNTMCQLCIQNEMCFGVKCECDEGGMILKMEYSTNFTWSRVVGVTLSIIAIIVCLSIVKFIIYRTYCYNKK